MSKNQMSKDEYILGTGSKGAGNLDLQHEIIKDISFAQLSRANLSKKMVVWDVGCGSGAMTEYLAKMVGSEGVVYAIDADEEQIQVTKKRMENAGYKNVIFIVGDINGIDVSKYKKADIVYSRLVLMHVRNPAQVISVMSSLLKSGGIVSLHEASKDSVKQHVNSNLFVNQFHDLVVDYGKIKGFDYNVGVKLPDICKGLNLFTKIEYYTNNYETTDQVKELFLARLDEIENKFTDLDLIPKGEYQRLVNNIYKVVQDTANQELIILPRQFHILAYSKKS